LLIDRELPRGREPLGQGDAVIGCPRADETHGMLPEKQFILLIDRELPRGRELPSGEISKYLYYSIENSLFTGADN
jgi:hypothetical protein